MVPLDLVMDRPSPAPNPGQVALGRAEAADALVALARLSTRDREVLLLVAAGELDFKSVGKILGISSAAVKMRVHRARRRLAAQVEADHERL
jgi:RNA polymerase sigma-70 factor (ECF subfamily)